MEKSRKDNILPEIATGIRRKGKLSFNPIKGVELGTQTRAISITLVLNMGHINSIWKYNVHIALVILSFSDT